MENVARKLNFGPEAAWEARDGQVALARFAIGRITAEQVNLHRQRTAARQLLFTLLAETFGSGAQCWTIGRRASGAPMVEGASEAVEVSLSHSGCWVAAGIGRGALIGVDIEQVRPGRDTEKLADYLGWAIGPDDAAGFYRQWTLWEALLKSRDGATPGPGVEAVLDGGTGVLHGFSKQPREDVFCALVLKTAAPANITLARLDQLPIQAW